MPLRHNTVREEGFTPLFQKRSLLLADLVVRPFRFISRSTSISILFSLIYLSENRVKDAGTNAPSSLRDLLTDRLATSI